MEHVPDSNPRPARAMEPTLPPHIAETKDKSVDEIVKDLKRSPFFMTSQDDVEGEEENPELEAFRALMDEGTRLEQAESARERGNDLVRAKKWKDGKEFYTKGLMALRKASKEDPTDEDEEKKEEAAKEVLLVNRALCHLELRTSPRFEVDSVQSGSSD